MKLSILVMTGIGFAWGLLLGLTLQLPAVSSPHFQDGSEINHLRKTREVQHQAAILSNLGLSVFNNNDAVEQGPGGAIENRNVYGKTNENPAEYLGNHQRTYLDGAKHLNRPYNNNALSSEQNYEIDTSEELLLKKSQGKNHTLHASDTPISSVSKRSRNRDIALRNGRDRVSPPLQQDTNTSNNMPERAANSNKAKDTLSSKGKINLKSMSDESGKPKPTHTELSHQISQHNEEIFANHQSLETKQEGEAGAETATSPRMNERDNAKPSHHHQFVALSDIVQGVYWTPQIEALTPQGFTDRDVNQWRKLVQTTRVVGMNAGCGRMQNRKLVFKDATEACARYRINTDQMQGEIYSYYMGKLLGIRNIPPSVLSIPNNHDDQWSQVHPQLIQAQWNYEKPVIVTPWLQNLQPAYIPSHFRHENRSLFPHPDLVSTLSIPEIVELVQWSDLVILDYLTANLDRVVNNMFNLQWNSQMMDNPTHNLERAKGDNLLVFLDNESGLFHGYRLLEKYQSFHEKLLKSLCIFRKTTADAIRYFHESQTIGKDILELFVREETLHHTIPRIPEKNVKTLQRRIEDVYKQIVTCENRYHR